MRTDRVINKPNQNGRFNTKLKTDTKCDHDSQTAAGQTATECGFMRDIRVKSSSHGE